MLSPSTSSTMPADVPPIDVQTLLETMDDGFYVINRDWCVGYVNRAVEQIWNRRRDEVVGHDLLTLFPQIRGSDVHAALLSALNDGIGSRFETIGPMSGMFLAFNVVPTASGASVYFHDVSVRRRMEREFRERGEILTLAEQSAGIGVWEIDIASETLRGTAQFFRIMGLDPTSGSVPIEAIRRLRYPADREQMAKVFEDLLAKGLDEFEVEYRIRRPDGATRWILGRGRVIRDASGVPVRYSGVDVDITERTSAEAALRESEARFRRVFEQSPLGKATADPDLRMREVNPALCSMLGYPAEALIGRHILDLVHPDDREHCAGLERELLAGTTTQIQLEERFLRQGGEPVWVRANIGAIHDSNGRMVHALCVLENIDERKQMIQALQDSEQRLRDLNHELQRQVEERASQLASSRAQLQAFFDNSPDWLTLQRAGPDGRFIYVALNPACEAAYGLPREQVVGRGVDEVLGAEAAQVPLQNMRACLRTGEPQRYVARRTMAGRTRTIDVFVAPLPGAPDGERFLITTARDITEREQLEEQLRQAQKLEAIGKLTGGVAHDFNNLLAVITGNAELAKRRSPANLPKLMDSILHAAGRGVTLTRQLLSFSRRQASSPQVLDLRTELPRIDEMLGTPLKGSIIRKLTVADDIWPIDVDPGELEIALLNVAMNARDAMPNGGQFDISAHNARTEAGEFVSIALHDTGAGIPHEIIGKVFDPFFTTKQPGDGTGLGLSQVYGFAQQSGGSVSVVSLPGSGTTVTLRLPRSTKPLPLPASRLEAVATGSDSGCILLVEDNPQVARVTVEMLGTMGFETFLADRAEKALSLLDTATRFDLLLTDVMMPDGINGLELANRVRARFATLPIVLMSGYNDIVGNSGADFLTLRKPVAYEELRRAIIAAMASSVQPVVTPPPAFPPQPVP